MRYEEEKEAFRQNNNDHTGRHTSRGSVRTAVSDCS